MRPKRTAIALAAALFMCCPALGTADPIPIVGGTFTVGAWIPTTMNLHGADGSRFTATWTGQMFDAIAAVAQCSSCGPGTLVSPNVLTHTGAPFLGASHLITGSAVAGGVRYPPPGASYPFMAFEMNLHFTGEAFTLPSAATVPEDSVFQAVVPFTLAGLIQGYDIFRLDPLQLFSAELYGSGVARVELIREGNLNGFLYYRTTFDFAEPVPEPATWMLVGSGAVALRTIRRRRSKNARVA